uniref:Zinc finger protein 416 n=3 Tax=Culex pipiens TaxID=7175 RepID=A0A8D8NUL5_CULPI
MMDLCRLTSAAVDQPDDIKMVEIDFQALCRVCGALGENLTSVFGKRAADRLRERITRYLQIEIRSEDCLPTKICDGCRETLDQFHELYDKCHRTDEKFRSMMNSAEELKEATEQQQQLQPSSPEGKQRQQQKKEARNSKVDSVIDADMKSLEPEEEEEESGRPRKVPGESAKKNTKEIKRKAEEEDQEASPETKGDYHLRHAIRVVGYSEHQAGMLKDESAEESEEMYSDYQFIDAEEEEEAYDDGAVSSLGRAPTMSLNRDIVEAARVIEEDGSISYECAECGKRIRSPHTYQAHLRIHNGERPFQCSQCPRTFRISQGLVRHVREVHERRRTYACEICGDRFGNKRNLDQHRNRHTNERPYRCETCGSSYNQKAALLIHSRVHGAERNFVCGVCSRGFHTRTKLQLHESTHSDERPFGCDQCELRFRNTHDLRRHSKNHSADKQFQCGLCAGLFKQKRYLLKHLKTQHQHDAETR